MKSEFEFINQIRQRFSLTKIGDDCAVIPKNSKTYLVVTTDLLIEDIDFRLDWTRAEFLGQKALAVSLSDVAAMGAKPVWAMLSIGIPEKIWKTDFVDEFYKGYLITAKKFEVELIGGDVSKSPDKIVIDSIVAGETRKGKAVLRSGAKSGDLIFVSGSLGGASAGLKLLKEGFRYTDSEKAWRKNLLLKQLQPYPRVSAGKQIGEENLATAMIDLSDGLSSDLAHLCRESKVGAKIFADKIPLHKNLRSMTKSFDEQLDFALNGGEDFELLFTANPKKNFQSQKEQQNFAFPCIGEVTANVGIIELVKNSESTILQPKGYRHF